MRSGRTLPLCILCFLLFNSPASGQQAYIDSLLSLLPVQQDTQRANFLNDIGEGYYRLSLFDTALLYIEEAHALSVQNEFLKGESRALCLKGMVLFELGDFAEGIKLYFAALKILENVGQDQEAASLYNNIGNIYRKQKNYSEALKNHFKALDIRKKSRDERDIAISWLNIATVYKNMLDYEQSLQYYDSAQSVLQRLGELRGISIIRNNVANIHVERGDYEKGLKMYFLDMNTKEGSANKVALAWTLGNIGETYDRMGKSQLAKEWIQKSLDMALKIGNRDILQNSYHNISKVEAQLGNYKAAYTNYVNYISYRDSLYNKEQTRKIAQTALSYEYDKREALAALQHKKDLEKTQIWYGTLSTIAFLLAILGFSLFYILRLKKKKEQQLWAVQQQVMALKQQEAERELGNAHLEMDRFLKKINEKNDLIEKISAELNDLKTAQPQISPDVKTKLAEIRNLYILTDDDWVTFLSSFSKIYPNFTKTLKEKCPKITNSELRYLMLTKIGLLHKEMANVLGVSPDTVRVTWSRVRNKLNGTLDDSPMELLNKWVA